MNATFNSIYGVVASAWTKNFETKTIDYIIQIPPNTKSSIRIMSPCEKVFESGFSLAEWEEKGIVKVN